MTDTRGGWRLAVVAALAAVACGVGVSPASAHDELIGATPADGAIVEAAPLTIVLEFFEPVASAGPAAPTLELRDDEGTTTPLKVSFDDRTVTGLLPRGMTPGTYAVGWAVESDDGHLVQGITRFAIKEPSTPLEYTGAATDSPSGDSSTPVWLAAGGGVVGAALVAAAVIALRRKRAA